MAAIIAVLLAATAPPAIPKVPTPLSHAPVLVSIARYREAGATVRKLVVRRNGYVTIDDPGGGAGRRMSSARLRRPQLDGLRHAVARTHLTTGRASLPEADPVAYFLLRYAGRERVVHADGMNAGLKPLVRRLNAILDSGTITLNSRFFAAS